MTIRAKLPGLPAPNFADPAVQRWAQAVSERLEVREGARGDPLERVVTWRDLDASFAGGSGRRVSSPSVLSGTAQIPTGNGQIINIDMETFAEQLKSTQLYRDLQFSISDPNRFARLGAEVNEFLTRSLTAEAAARSAQIARTDIKLLEVSRSVAATSVELTAALDTTAAGLRSTQFAIATESGATAGQVTTLEARLQVEVNPEDLLPVPPAAAYANLAALIAAVPAASADTRKYYRVAGTPEDLYRSNGTTYSLVGTEESAKLEEVLLVTADKSLGLEAQYTLKVNAGNAIAGFGIAATERDGVPESAFIIQADKFALSTPFTFSQELTPTATAVGQTWYKPSTQVAYRATAVGTGGWVVYTPIVPFGVDTTTGNVFISGSLRVGSASSPTATQVSTAATNFDSRNDRNGAAVLAPTIASDGTAVDHTINTDGSADLSFEWLWAGTEADIDGFIITTYTDTTNAAYTFGTTPSAETTFTVPANKRALIGYGLPANNYYKLGVQAYRAVDPDVNAAGIIRSAMVVPSLSAENPYRPSANVAFAGDITGTVNGTAVATVVTGAANGTTALTAVNDGTSGLATKLGLASRNVLTGGGGVAAGTIAWDSSTGAITPGTFGVALNRFGIVARNSSGDDTFVLDGTNGNAVYSGTVSASKIIAGTINADIATAKAFVLDTNGKLYTAGKTTAASGTAGVFLGYDGGTYKLSIGDATKNLTWDGSALTISGTAVTDGVTLSTIRTNAAAAKTATDGLGALAVQNAVNLATQITGLLANGNVAGLGALALANSVNLGTQVTGSLPNSSVSGLGALAVLSTVDLSTHVTGSLPNSSVSGLGALALLGSVNLGTATVVGDLAATRIGAGTLAAGVVYAGSVAATQITAGTLAAGVIYAGTIAATQISAGTLAAGVIYAGSIDAVTGTFSGNISTSGQVSATGTTSSAAGTACIVGASATSGVRGGAFIATNTTGVVGLSTSGAGVYGTTSSTSASTPGVLGGSGAGGIAIATEVGSIQINSFNSNMIIGTATNTGNNNLVIKEGTAGSRLNDQILIYGQLSANNDTTLGLVVEQDVEAGTGSFAGLVQLRIHINGVAYKWPLEAY
jgi:hypothetical protein